jgi:hypothetical protein
MSAFARPGSFAAQSLQALRQLFRDLSDPYRPELHYMRGPGPKWREKHGSQKGPNREAVRGRSEYVPEQAFPKLSQS